MARPFDYGAQADGVLADDSEITAAEMFTPEAAAARNSARLLQDSPASHLRNALQILELARSTGRMIPRGGAMLERSAFDGVVERITAALRQIQDDEDSLPDTAGACRDPEADLRGEPIPLRCRCGSTDIRTEQEPLAVCGACGTVGMLDDFRRDCTVCGEAFNPKRLMLRRAIGKTCCIQCAIDNDEALHVDDDADVNERKAGRID